MRQFQKSRLRNSGLVSNVLVGLPRFEFRCSWVIKVLLNQVRCGEGPGTLQRGHSHGMAGAGTYAIVYWSGCVVRDRFGKMARFAGHIPASAKVDVLGTITLYDAMHRGRIDKWLHQPSRVPGVPAHYRRRYRFYCGLRSMYCPRTRRKSLRTCRPRLAVRTHLGHCRFTQRRQRIWPQAVNRERHPSPCRLHRCRYSAASIGYAESRGLRQLCFLQSRTASPWQDRAMGCATDGESTRSIFA